MKYRRILAGIALSLVLFLASPGGLTVAADKSTDKTDNGKNPGITTAGSSETGRKDDQKSWQEIKEAVKPYQKTMKENQQAFQALREELVLKAADARHRVEILLTATLTETDLLSLQKQIAQLQKTDAAVRADQGSLGREMKILSGKKADLDLAGVTQSFLGAIAIQEARLAMVAQAIMQVEAICP